MTIFAAKRGDKSSLYAMTNIPLYIIRGKAGTIFLLYMTVATIVQIIYGNIDVSIFAFPMGLALGVTGLAIVYAMEHKWGPTKTVAAMRSAKAACLLLGLTAAFAVAGGLVPQFAGFTTSWPFVALLAALEMHLSLVIIHKLRTFRFRRDLSFMLVHIGLWLALFSGMAGAGDTRKSDILVPAQAVAPSPRLLSFQIDRNPAYGSPVQYSAEVMMNGDTISLAVNSPYHASMTEDLYLVDFNTNMMTGEVDYCILQKVHQPWKYPMLAGIGSLLAGTIIMTTRRRKEAER